MHLKELELSGFKSFARKTALTFASSVTAIVGPNGSGKSNIAESFRFVLGEQSMKSMRSKRGEDLIFNGTPDVSRANRAGAKLVFDNTDRLFDVDFDEVALERIVHRDGTNEYKINGSTVRLKDVHELLAKAHIGSSGHHIISQGEADRILNNSSADRKAMIEDALGLRVYQYKKQEAEKKLIKTESNVKEVQSLRRENAPHLKFLARQVEKVEKTRAMRDEIKTIYKEYFKRESEYLKHTKEDAETKLEEPRRQLVKAQTKLKKAEELSQKVGQDDGSGRVLELERELAAIRERRDEFVRAQGNVEGEISSFERIVEQEKQARESDEDRHVSVRDLKPLLSDLESVSETETDVSRLHALVRTLREALRIFVETTGVMHTSTRQENLEATLVELREKQKNIISQVEEVEKQEQAARDALTDYKQEIEQARAATSEAEKQVLILEADIHKLEAEIAGLEGVRERVVLEDEEFKRDLQEAGALVGAEALQYKMHVLALEDILSESRDKQKERKKKIETLKIRIEDAGGGSGDEVVAEYTQVKSRDEFLVTEIEDLEKSSQSLKELIGNLEEEINTKFKQGIGTINTEFQKLFALMFGGGTASLRVVKQEAHASAGDLDMSDEEAPKEGIEISVSLPRKKIRGLDMLSGGERALTSIALLFAMSQVNPPPFIILDETDAALDESNSRKYGDMVERLADKSQLILITHNRETMSRAGVLYGITMGSNGVSKLLSIAFDDAVSVAK